MKIEEHLEHKYEKSGRKWVNNEVWDTEFKVYLVSLQSIPDLTKRSPNKSQVNWKKGEL